MRLGNFAARAAAVTTAAAVTLGGAAIPATADVDFGAVTTGPLFGIAQAIGYTTIPIQDVDVIGTITIHTAWQPALPIVLADAVNAVGFGGYNPLGASFRRQPGGTLGSVILGGSGFSAYNAGIAYGALLASAGGNTPAGYTPLEPAGKVSSLSGAPCTSGPTCVQGANITNLAVLQVNNPGTPNGGLYARFAPILNLFGVQAVSAGGASGRSTGIELNAATVGLALGYNALSDFPATPNPFSLINSTLATALPTHLLGGGTLQGASEDLLYARLGALATLNVPSTSYSTYVPDDLPLLEPLRLPARLVNTVLGALGVAVSVPTPLADALQPALQILVNTGYTDVQTPTDGGTYNRTYKSSGDAVPFLSQAVLSPDEWLRVPGDVLCALVVGFQDSFPVLRLGQTAPTLTVDGNHLAISYPPAPSAPVAARTPVRSSAAAVARSVPRQSAASGTVKAGAPHAATAVKTRPIRNSRH